MTAEATTSRRRATGSTLLIVSALGTAGFAGWSMAQLQQTSPESFLSEAWHAFGLIVFAGLFALVAWRPRAYPGLMELTILHSIGMFVLAFTTQDAAGATATMILHGLLTLALLISYVVLGCVKAWGKQPVAAPATPAGRKDGAGSGNPRTGDPKSSSPATSSETAAITGKEAPKTTGAPRTQPAPNQRGIDSSPAAPPQTPGTQPTRQMPQNLPEDRPRG